MQWKHCRTKMIRPQKTTLVKIIQIFRNIEKTKESSPSKAIFSKSSLFRSFYSTQKSYRWAFCCDLQTEIQSFIWRSHSLGLLKVSAPANEQMCLESNFWSDCHGILTGFVWSFATSYRITQILHPTDFSAVVFYAQKHTIYGTFVLHSPFPLSPFPRHRTSTALSKAWRIVINLCD